MASSYRRLPKNPLPLHYRLQFEPDLTKNVFHGRAAISIEVTEAISKFSLYSTDLNISGATIEKQMRKDSVAKVNVTPEEDERIRIDCESALQPGRYILSLEFDGELSDKMNGFYRSTYKSKSGETCTMALTQFEAAFARRAFPCWDEPSFKATFDVAIVAPEHLTVLSNMPVAESILVAGQKKVSFERSPKMSTYLLAFVIGDLGYTEAYDSNQVKIRVYTRKGYESQGSFALDVAVKVLPYYSEYFDLKYPLPKLDLVAVPDFAAGAMENWGLVTYRETALLVDSINTSRASQQYVALVVGHELAHQWFGNLVTMEWWTDLWLNEGFASWIEYLSVDKVMPELNIWTQFVFLDMRRALELDGLRSSHPIEVAVGSPDEVDQIFDSISYSKGACVIRMLHSFMGEERFKQGLRMYLKEFAYSNAQTADLWRHLSSAAAGNKDIGLLMNKWTRQMGYPLVQVKGISESGNDALVELEQRRFLLDGSEDRADHSPWQIPVSFCVASQPNTVFHNVLFNETKQAFTIPNAAKEKWIKINANTVGLFVVQYPDTIIANLVHSVPTLSVLDRFNLQSDLNLLCRAGLSSFTEYMRLATAYSAIEQDYTVWRDIVSNIGHIRTLVEQSDDRAVLRKFDLYVIKLLEPIYNKLGFSGDVEDDLRAMLRGVVIRALGMAGHEPVVKECLRVFESHTIDPNIRSAVYSTVVKHDGKYLTKLIDMHKKADLAEEKNRLLCAMGCVQSKDLKQSVLEYTIGDHVRTQDGFYGFMSVAGSDKIGQWITWAFFKEHFRMLLQRYKDANMMSSLIKRSLGNFCELKAVDEIRDFFTENPCPHSTMAIDQILESIQTNAKAYETDYANIVKYLG